MYILVIDNLLYSDHNNFDWYKILIYIEPKVYYETLFV